MIEAAQRCWLGADLPTVHVNIAFAASARLRKSDWSNWGRRLVEMVQAALPDEEGQQSVIGIGPQHLLSSLAPPAEIEQIVITRPRQDTETFFALTGGGGVHGLTTDQVQSRIDAKNERLTVYKQVAAESWLIIGCNSFRFSTFFTIPDDTLEHVYESNFDRLFLVGLSPGRVHELKSTVPTS